MKRITFLIILLILTGCRYFNVSPVNGLTIKNLTEKPTQKEIVGLWEVDKISYDLIEEKGYEKKEIELNLKSNGTFEITNLPNFINVFDQTSEKYVDTDGTWQIGKDSKEENWVLHMRFNDSNLYENGMSTSYDLFLEEEGIIIWDFIGDPDSGERFLYRKK
ncbi:hypothetical protein [Salinimicrobium xinjiangense]|uniref:hypothetical protein n=1 Tax=Salinimicrobium xinjiangense TaxID=438596 RepID=UPI0012EC4A51|nr:hypothetical protein [Salinimicrobium xinjiangense]